MIFNYTYDSNTFTFFFSSSAGDKFTIEEWQGLQSEFLSQIAILAELHDNGFAEYTNDACSVDSIDVLRLNDTDKQILGLPSMYPYEIYIEPDGILTQSTFRFQYGFYDFCPNGTKFRVKRNGAMIAIHDNEYLLSENQYKVCEAIDEFNSLPDKDKGSVRNLKKLSEIKSLSTESGLALDHFLSNQNLYIPEKIKLDVDFSNGLLEIYPVLEIQNASGFTNTFDRLPTIRDVYPVPDNNGGTTRVVISDKLKPELQKIKNIRNVSDPSIIQSIVDHPELFANPDYFDIDALYSDRVKEIGIYSPKFYPFASPYKSEWIPGIVIRDKVHGEKRIYFKSHEKLSDFIEHKEKAVKEGLNTIQWENAEIPIDEAEKFIQTAKKQFENPNKPVKNEKNIENEVLIIKENADLTEFSNGIDLPENLKHDFYKVNNLTDGILLMEHQKEGVSWLQSLYKENLSGGLLADDMGLGKTLQLLYFIEWHCQYHNDNKPYLIVAPVSLLENWENEYQKFFNPQNLPLKKLYGDVSLARENNPAKNQHDAKQLQQKQIILTNYETIRSYQISLGLVDFAVVALDEAQKIKTPGTLITNACKALKADFKLAMTGTPVENTLVDIWCIMDYAVPGLLGNAKDFAKEFQNPLKDVNTEIKALTERLRNRIGVFIKRRLKIDVAKDLPEKHDNAKSRIKKVMPLAQLERYNQEIEQLNSIELHGVEKSTQKLKSIHAIRDISDHPYLLESQILNFPTDELISSSAKLQITVGILADIKSKGEKAIVFADRKETQRMLQKIFYDVFKVFSSIINGDTPTIKKSGGAPNPSRQQAIDGFQAEAGFNIIIMSPIAAGVGLNVTKANHIIHYSRHWNPAKEDQATDRAYRIGQQKDVYVYYPMAVFPDSMRDENGERLRSFDEILDILLNNKKTLASNTLFPTEQAEITPSELFGGLYGIRTEHATKSLTLNEIDKFLPDLFEACIGALYRKQGFEVDLTPYTNDKGVDVVVLGEEENYLLQVKQSRSLVGNGAIQEICTAKKYYENKYGKLFTLVAISNNDYSSSAELLARHNQVKLINRNYLEKMLLEHSLTLEEVNRMKSQRLSRI